MAHENYEELVSAFVDGYLSAEEEMRLFTHLAGCAHCREFLRASMALQGEMLATKPMGAPPLELKPGAVLRPRIWQRSVPFPIAAVLAVVALTSTIAFTSFWMRPKEKPAETTQEVVYIQRLPAIQVIGFYPPDNQGKK